VVSVVHEYVNRFREDPYQLYYEEGGLRKKDVVWKEEQFNTNSIIKTDRSKRFVILQAVRDGKGLRVTMTTVHRDKVHLFISDRSTKEHIFTL